MVTKKTTKTATKKPAKKPAKKTAKKKALTTKSKKVVEGATVEPEKGPGGPRITKGGKLGVYTTPMDLISAVLNRFGAITFDLAALKENAKAANYFTPKEDALKQDWSKIDGLCWLNPPFTFLRPWVERCLEQARKGANILCLVPAAVGSRWFRHYVLHQADVYFLEGRLTFDQEAGTPYPKDCMLVHFHAGMKGAIETWDWRDDMDPKYMSDRRRKKLEKEASEAAEA